MGRVLQEQTIQSQIIQHDHQLSFSNPGHAFNLAKKLNTLFNVQDFTVVKLTQGETVTEK